MPLLGKAGAGADRQTTPPPFPCAILSWRSVLGAALLLASTAPAAAQERGKPPAALARLEAEWLTFRTLRDQLGVTRNLGDTVSPRGIPVDTLAERVRVAAARVRALAAMVAPGRLSGADSAAFRLLRSELESLSADLTSREAAAADAPDCAEPLPARLRGALLDTLTERTFACYGAAARRIVVDKDTLDRLSILGLLGRTDDRERRHRLFMALEPIWRSVNGDDGDGSPYRTMVRLRLARWGTAGTPMAGRARELGVAPDTVEQWLVRMLEAWRALGPDSLIEPWDFHYANGAASRLLSARIRRDSLRPLSERFYRSLGADLPRLRVHFDLAPRPGKYPVSFTDFGGRSPIEPWIFTSYRIGGLDNLAELLHEEGHAVHIAAIRTRGAWTDWPDSDTFTEAIADLAADELYEPAWQRAFLGREAPLTASLRAKYGGVALDAAWALFEIRVHRAPERSPNAVWSEIARDYLRIRPHPEWSWWALRGQLVNHPGYLLNYAFGAVLIADVRARLIARHGRFTTGDPSWYGWVAPRLYRFGRERSAREVLEGFLGRPVSPEALLQDLARARRGGPPGGTTPPAPPPRPGRADSAQPGAGPGSW
jgi:hypothetical protein